MKKLIFALVMIVSISVFTLSISTIAAPLSPPGDLTLEQALTPHNLIDQTQLDEYSGVPPGDLTLEQMKFTTNLEGIRSHLYVYCLKQCLGASFLKPLPHSDLGAAVLIENIGYSRV